MWRDVRHPKNPSRLLFRYDPDRLLIQVQEKGEKHVIDLTEFQSPPVEKRETLQEPISKVR